MHNMIKLHTGTEHQGNEQVHPLEAGKITKGRRANACVKDRWPIGLRLRLGNA